MDNQPYYVPQQLVPTRISALLAEKQVYMNKPKMQRSDRTWPRRKKQYFIESLLRGIPVPSMILHHDAEQRAGKLWIADGLQRLTSIIEFADGKFATGRNRPGAPSFGAFEANKTIAQLSSSALNQFKGYNLPLQIIETADQEIIKFIFLSLQNAVQLTLGERLYAQGHDSDSVIAIEQIQEHDFFKRYIGGNEHRETYMMAQFPLVLELNNLFAEITGERLRNLASDFYVDRITNEMIERIEENLLLAQHLFGDIKITSKNEVLLMYQAVALLKVAGFDLFNSVQGALSEWYRQSVPAVTIKGSGKAFGTLVSQINKNAYQEKFWQLQAEELSGVPGLYGDKLARQKMERIGMWLHHRHICPNCHEIVGNVHRIDFHQFLPTDTPCLSDTAIKIAMSEQADTRELIGAD